MSGRNGSRQLIEESCCASWRPMDLLCPVNTTPSYKEISTSNLSGGDYSTFNGEKKREERDGHVYSARLSHASHEACLGYEYQVQNRTCGKKSHTSGQTWNSLSG